MIKTSFHVEQWYVVFRPLHSSHSLKEMWWQKTATKSTWFPDVVRQKINLLKLGAGRERCTEKQSTKGLYYFLVTALSYMLPALSKSLWNDRRPGNQQFLHTSLTIFSSTWNAITMLGMKELKKHQTSSTTTQRTARNFTSFWPYQA